MAKDFLIRIVGDASKGISELDKFAKKADDLTHLGQAGMVMGGLIAAGIGVAVSKYAEFDAAMSGVIASGEDAAANQDALRQAAMDAGASTVFSATESANAIEELAKAGISAADTLSGGLAGSLDLAAAGGLGVADAASIMATAMTQFSVKGSQATHVADLLAAGAGKAQGDVSDLSQALGQAGLVANATGLTIEETTGGLAAFASAGLLGSDAGTSFKSMLQRLTPQSAEAQRAMDELGISAYDAQGNFIGLSEFAGNLQQSMRGLTPEARQAAMATIFGSDAVRAATILYNEGAEGIQEWTAAVDDQGYAAEVARKRLDNLQGDVEALGGALDTALIQTGSGANDSLRALTATATGIVEWFSQLPGPVIDTGLALGAAAAATGLLGGGALVTVPKVLALKGALEGTAFSLRGVALAAGGVTIGLAAAIAIVGNMAAEQAAATARAEAYADTLEDGTQRITASTRKMAQENLAAEQSFLWFQQGSAYDNAEALGISLDLVTDAAMGSSEAIDQLQKELAAAEQGHEGLGLSAQAAQLFADRLSDSVKGEASSLDEAKESARQKEEAERSATAATDEASAASGTAAAEYLNEANAASGLTEELDQLIKKLNEGNDRGQDAVTSNARYRESLAGIADEVKRQRDEYERTKGTLDGFSLSLDENTVSGSANASALASVASDAQAAAAAQYELDKTTVGAKTAADNYAGTLAAQRAAFEDAARGAGYNADEVQRLADKVFALPPVRAVDVLAETGAATQRTQDFKNLWESVKNRTVTLTTIGNTQIGGAAAAAVGPMLGSYAWGGNNAVGGLIQGPGTGTSDSILAAVSNGEFVVREAVASRHIGLLTSLNATGELPRYADGGLVGFGVSSTVSMADLASPSSTVPVQPLAGNWGASDGDIADLVASRVAVAVRGTDGGSREVRLSDSQIDQIVTGIASSIRYGGRVEAIDVVRRAFRG